MFGSVFNLMINLLNKLLAGQEKLLSGQAKLGVGQDELLVSQTEQAKLLKAQDGLLKAHADLLNEIRKQQQSDGDVLHRIEDSLKAPPLPAPLPITEWRATAERKENDMTVLDYEAKLPPIPDVPENADVVSQRVTVTADGAEVSVKEEPKLADVTNFTVKKGASVTLTRSLLDDDGNEGPKTASETFVAKDTIPPSAPGDFGAITNLGEREVPDA